MSFDRTRSAGALASDIARLYAAGLQQALAPLGLAPAQFLALTELWEQDGLTQRELAKRLAVEQATMANTLARMQRDGLVDRRAHPDDGRSQQVWLTQQASGLRVEAVKAAAKASDRVTASLPAAERELFLSMLSRVAAGLRDAGDD